MSLLDDVSIVVTPNGYKAGTLYGVLPTATEGAELVVNGDFSSGTSPWALNPNWSLGGVGVIADGTSNSTIWQSGVVEDNKQYIVTYTLTDFLQGSINVDLSGGNGITRTVAGTYTEVITSGTSPTTRLSFEGGLSFKVTLSNISVKEWTASDMDVTRETAATRVNENGLVEEVLSNVPRIDYTGGGCPHILAEPQRTNLVTYSEDFSNASWLKVNSTVNPNTSVSPDGTLNADEFIPDNTTASIFIYNQVTFSASDYTLSFFIKYNGRQYVQLLFGSGASSDFSNFDLINHTVTSGNGSIEDYGNDWYKISLTSNVSAGSSEVYLWSIDSATSLRAASSTGNGTDGYYVYGGQLEQGSYLTSYIPTSGSTVTRNQDEFTRDGIGSLINSTEGVLFTEMSALSDDNTDRRLSLNDGSANNEIRIGYSRFTGNIISEVASGGITQNINWGATGVTQTNNNKFALSWGGGTLKFYVNGSQTNIETGITSPVGLNTLKFSKGNDTEEMFAKVKQLQVYNTALTDMQLIQLTGTAGTDFYESYSEMAESLTYTIQ